MISLLSKRMRGTTKWAISQFVKLVLRTTATVLVAYMLPTFVKIVINKHLSHLYSSSTTMSSSLFPKTQTRWCRLQLTDKM